MTDSSAKVAASNSVRGHVTTLLPFARDDAGSYAAAAVLAALGTLCQLGPFYVIYLAIRDLLAGSTTLSGMVVLAVAALVLLVAQYVLPDRGLVRTTAELINQDGVARHGAEPGQGNARRVGHAKGCTLINRAGNHHPKVETRARPRGGGGVGR